MFYKSLFVLIICISNITFANSVSIKAIVDGNIITSYDIEQRKKLSSSLLKHNNINMPDEQITKNVFNEMIDDKIKIAEARKYNIIATPDEIESAKSRMAQLLKLGPNGYNDILKESGVSEDVLNEQIKADIIWSKFVMQVLRSYIKVQDSEVNNFIENPSQTESYEYTLIPFILKNDNDADKVKDIKTCDDFEKFATENGKAGSGFKMNIIDSQMQKTLYNITKNAPLLTPLDAVELNGEKTILFICDKKSYTPTITAEEKDRIKYMLYQNKLDAYANKYFERLKSSTMIDIKE
ncbi:MAG: SurA N-terminal domain-containing protein [Alphaproteobacteria bacterium]